MSEVCVVKKMEELTEDLEVLAKQIPESSYDKFSRFLDNIPIVGHIKGAIHISTGDYVEGNQSILAATRTLLVAAIGGTLGTISGPIGAYVAGSTAGIVLDGIFTWASEVPSGPCGIWALVEEQKDLSEYFYTTLGFMMDGFLGYLTYEFINYILRGIYASKVIYSRYSICYCLFYL